MAKDTGLPQLPGVHEPPPKRLREVGRPWPLPSAPDSDTSADAADSMKGKAGAIRLDVLAFIRRRGDEGATADEVQVALGLTHQTSSARVSELANKFEMIEDSGRRRKTRSGSKAAVYVSV